MSARRKLPILVLLVAMSTMFVGPAPVFSQVGKPEVLYYKSWAIVIGIEDYLVAPKLPGAVDDAKLVAEGFRRLGFDEVIEIYDKKATSRQVGHIFDNFLPRKVGRMDRVVVYFAGHAGVTQDMDGKDVGYIVPWDVPVDKVDKSFTLHQLKAYSHRISAKHILFFLDTGVSGWEVTPSRQLSLEGRMSPEGQMERRALQVLTAAQAGERVIRQDGQGLFVRTLLAGLEGASDTDKNGWILASELSAYVAEQVTQATDGTQHPQFARLDGDGDMILREGRIGPHGGMGEPQTEEDRKAAAQTLYYQALTVLQNREPAQGALDLLNQALGYDPTYSDAYILKAFLLLERVPDIDGALEAATMGVQLAPENPDSHFTFGLVLQRKAMYPEAERAYLKALKVNPTYEDVYLVLGDLYANDLKDQTKAVETYERYLQQGGTTNRAREYIQQSR